ncbi:MAG: transporter substrate-binding domain-containing protein [Deltaproteobacteria bacterium]|nr:transporter substrate-binding domain-containing protein [Deltaproteobacteria bacterium]
MRVAVACWMGVWLACGYAAHADAPQIIRVGTSGDYAPFSLLRVGDENAGEVVGYAGFDPAVARAWAKAGGFELRFVRFRWPELLDDLAADRFDVAMSGITVRTDRSLAGRFSVPVAFSGAIVLLPADSPVRAVAELNRPGTRIAVNAGGHLESVARARFPRALLRPQSDNESVPSSLRDGRAEAVVTDTHEAPHWMARYPGLRALGPFTHDRKAYLFGADEAELAQDLDAWLLRSEADGTLARLRTDYLDEPGVHDPIAAPLPALLAAMDERLALMPMVAEAKRQSGTPVEAPERETMVLRAAQRSVQEAAARRPTSRGDAARGVPSPRSVRRFFVAQIEAAKDVQRATLATPAGRDASPPPDLARSLRPALLRIGQRIAFLLIELPAELDRASVAATTRDALARHGLSAARLDELSDALVALAAPPAAATGVPDPPPRMQTP